MRAAIIGGTGMLGTSLIQTTPRGTDVVWQYGRSSGLGVQDREYRNAVFDTHPDVIINCSAVHDVNKIEADLSRRLLAVEVNGYAVTKLAEECERQNVYLIHMSTDYVFNEPLKCEIDEETPVAVSNNYAYTKTLGEQAIQKIGSRNLMIVRTSALFGPGSNFVNTMLSLCVLNKKIEVVEDQYTSPTYTKHLAHALWHMAKDREHYPNNLLHVSAGGYCSWYEFAYDILLGHRPNLNAVTTAEYNSAHPETAPRPLWSILGTKYVNSLPIPHWRYGLHEYKQEEQLL